MNKKIFSIAFFLISVLILAGAGCGGKSPANVPKQTNANPTDLCDSAKEIATPNALASELKSIFSEAGGEVKLTANIQQDSSIGDKLVYVWKNKPTAEKLENAFKKHGYKVEIVSESLIAIKGNTVLNIGLLKREDCQKIDVLVINKSINPGWKVTTEECAELFAMGPKIDLRYNDLPSSYPWTLKYYDKMAALEKKYGITQDELSKACKAKAGEPGFNEEVEKQEQELDAIIE